MAMIPHSMNVVKEAVAVLNPWTTPMITFDQPIYCSRLQSKLWERVVEMLGGQHNTMALLKALGDLFHGRSWMSALVQAEIATIGTLNSFLKAVHVKITALAHLIRACALYRLRQASYVEWPECSGTSFEEWCEQRAFQSPQFNFWQLNVLSIELVVPRPFSRIALDEGHEQNNAFAKRNGEVGLTASALLRWIVSGTEMARIIGQ
ncbi:hypothetical protein ACROYT_G042646 [Oculina patagonica]